MGINPAVDKVETELVVEPTSQGKSWREIAEAYPAVKSVLWYTRRYCQ